MTSCGEKVYQSSVGWRRLLGEAWCCSASQLDGALIRYSLPRRGLGVVDAMPSTSMSANARGREERFRWEEVRKSAVRRVSAEANLVSGTLGLLRMYCLYCTRLTFIQ
jgi:hypothetical protein